MSVAPRAAPSMSERSRVLSRRGSNREEEELAVGAVIVMLSDKTEDQSVAYRPSIAIGDVGQDDSKPISTTSPQKEQRFVAVLAPSCDAAMASLLSQPPGTYLLVKEEDAAITVYVKFRQAVRALTLVKGKDVKKNDDAIHLAKSRKKDIDVLMQTPVHTLRLVSEAYFLVEHCWKRFLPQVQAVVFELCCEPYLDEDTKLEDWNSSMIPADYSLALMPEACGFYILASNSAGPESASSAVIQVRQVEFDFNKFAITVADGTLKPSALLLSTSFSAKRTFEPYFTFSAIRDNFMSPDQVILKETSVSTTIPTQQTSLQNCIDLSSSDKELSILSAAEAACGAVMPHESLPEKFVTVICEMHVHFTDVTTNLGANPSVKPAPWSAQKMKLVERIIPILVELLIASATFSEKKSPTEEMDVAAAASEGRKRQILAQFSYAMRFDILFMTARSDDSVICRLTHQLCQLLGARMRLPSELVDFIRDLVALFPVFLRLFLRNQGISTLWKNLHHNDVDKDGASDSRSRSSIRSFRALASSSTVVNTLHGKGDRKPLVLFGYSRKPQTKSRKSLSLGTSTSTAPFLSSKALAFFRLSPLSVQVDLGTRLRESQFLFPDIWMSDAVLARISFCCCSKQHPDELRSRSVSFYGQPAPQPSSCVRRGLRSSPKMIMYELLLQLSLRFLYNKASFRSWDRDVALLLRLEDLYQHLFNEIICIVRRRAHLQDVNAIDALTCELRVVIACVSTLFRLERKRRQEISSASGDKKYSSFILMFRTKLRDLNERLKGEASSNDCQAEEAQTEGEDQIDEVDERFLIAMVEVFRWIPRAFLDEWIVLSLKELLQVLDALNGVIKQTPIPMVKQMQYVRHIHESFQVFAVIMKRISDPDLQKIIVRVLGMDCSSIVSLLRFALSTNTLCLNGGRDAVCIQKFALSFLGAFVNLDVALPVQTEWDSRNAKSCEDGCMNEDQEIIEQLKGELLIRLLGPRMLADDGEQNEQNLWDFILESLFSTNTVSGSSRMLSIAASFRSVTMPPTLLTAIARGHFQMKESFLQLQQALYTAQDVNSSVDYDICIASHMRHIGIYFDRIIENTAQEEKYMVYRAAELHFRCLVVLASRRSQSPAIHEAFNNAHVVATIVKWLQTQTPQQDTTSGVLESVEISSAVSCLPPLKLSRQHGATDSFSSQPGIAKLTLAAPHSVPFHEDVPFPQHFLLLESGLHALAIVLLVSFVIVEPNLEIDEKICPRVSVPGHEASTSDKPNELLWMLQQHLVAVEIDQRYFEALTLEMETLQAFVSTARLSAIRLMLRLLCPNRFDRNLYMNTSQTKSENALLVSSKHSREYIAKGAFSTVYKQHPALPRPEAVAIKVVEHQRRTGELCAVSGLYNEVSILSKLRGDLAATQLVDFGNHHAEQNFEIVMEYCPCSLTEWRATINRSDSGIPFRSCLVMILRAFEEACHCLSRVHQAGVCHFDIKSDNILVRSSAQELSRRLLENDDAHEDDAVNREFKAWLCIADFGESKLVNSHQLPVRTFTFSSFTSGSAFPVAGQRTEKSMSLSRTRGTEAIKSPEVLKIKGSEDVEVKVTLASDIWSLGCLLYELVTQELLFQNDDWAGLYAHLVVTQDQAVLRSDHRQKVFDALRPSSSDEEEVVSALTEICSKILCRDASKRPDLAAIAEHVRKLINDVYELPVTASDESFIISLYKSSVEASVSDTDCSLVPTLGPFVSPAPRSRRADANGVTVPVRFFWNFFLAAHITRTQDRQTVTSCVGNGHGPVSKDVLAMEAFEAKHEGDFVHFVYLAWHDNSAPPGGPDAHESLIEELYEDEHRTVFLLNPHLKASVETQLTSDVHLFQQLVQHAPHYFPVLQRRLREAAGCVVFVVLGRGEEDSKELQHVLTGMLLFFLRSAVAMTPFELLSCFARDCAQFFDYPRSEFLQHLLSYSTPVTEDTATSTVVQCQCGSSVLRVESSAMSEALAAQRCTCESDSECPSFHPFPLSVDDGSEDADDDVHPVDSMFEHDDCEEQLVHPIESRSRRGQGVSWLCVDAVSVSRADGSAFRWSPAGSRLGSSDSIRSVGSGSERRMSRFGLLKRRASKTAGDASPRPSGKEEIQEPLELLVRGLQRRGKPADADSPSSDKWELYECELCRLPICALSDGKVAVPLLHPRSND